MDLMSMLVVFGIALIAAFAAIYASNNIDFLDDLLKG